MIARMLQGLACATVVTLGVLPIAAAPPTAPNAQSKKAGAANTSAVPKEEALLVQGLEQLRAWKLTEADDTLGEVCPKFKEDAGEGLSLVDLACSARAVSSGEVKGAKDASQRADGYWWGGDRARRTDKLEVARAFFEVGLDRNPGDADIWTGLGRVQRETGDLEASTKTLRKAVELDATNFDAVYWLAANRMDQDDPAEAETLLRRIVTTDNEFGPAWYRLGQLEMRKNEPRSAIELFEKAKAGGVNKKLVRDRIAECRKALAPKAPH